MGLDGMKRSFKLTIQTCVGGAMPAEKQTSGPGRGATSTRDRLLDAGERLFAEHGFDATAVRDITAVARCNVAAVNYYFGGKENLYQEVFRRRLVALKELRISRLEEAMQSAGSEATLETVITAFISAFLEPLTASRAWRDLMRLFAREMLTPRLQSGMLMRERTVSCPWCFLQPLCSFMSLR
jgi:AcrR family transcriptional regulator